MDRRDISLAILIFMFLALLGAVSVWVAWRRPISILWKLPVLFLSNHFFQFRDTWHQTLEEAEAQANFDYGLGPEDWDKSV